MSWFIPISIGIIISIINKLSIGTEKNTSIHMVGLVATEKWDRSIFDRSEHKRVDRLVFKLPLEEKELGVCEIEALNFISVRWKVCDSYALIGYDWNNKTDQ